jgi:hypothetical protein
MKGMRILSKVTFNESNVVLPGKTIIVRMRASVGVSTH